MVFIFVVRKNNFNITPRYGNQVTQNTVFTSLIQNLSALNQSEINK